MRGDTAEGFTVDQVVLGEGPTTIEAIAAIARQGVHVSVGDAGRARIADAHAVVDRIVREERVAYGVTTGFGQLATTHVPVAQARELQENLVRSHSVGVGDPLPRDVVRAAMAIRINTFAKGHSGVRQQVVDLLCAMLDADLVPWVPSRGSLGASGDLAPSAHMVLAMMGEGELLARTGSAKRRCRGCAPPASSPCVWTPRKVSRSSTGRSSWLPSAFWPRSTPRRCWTRPT